MKSALTPKEETFSQHVALANTYADAYRIAYKTDKMSPHVVRQRAYEVADRPRVKARVRELLEKRFEESLWNDRQRAREFCLERFMLEATDMSNGDAARIRALENIARAEFVGFYGDGDGTWGTAINHAPKTSLSKSNPSCALPWTA